jgi:hypothetical protein
VFFADHRILMEESVYRFEAFLPSVVAVCIVAD